jgi:hypothetical protein
MHTLIEGRMNCNAQNLPHSWSVEGLLKSSAVLCTPFLFFALFLSFTPFLFFTALSVAEERVGVVTQTVVTVRDYSDSPSSEAAPGTLRYALNTAKPHTRIVFEKPGTIELKRPLEITTPDLEIDGTSQPMVLFGDSVRIRASRIRLRHLWILAGDEPPSEGRSGIDGRTKGDERDALIVLGPEREAPIQDITIEHCWIGFGIDECLSTYGNVERLVVQDSIVGFGLNRSFHSKDLSRPQTPGHSKGALVGLGARDVRFSRNLFVHNFDRNIAVREGVKGITFEDNLIYNFGRKNTFAVTGDEKSSVTGVFRGNVYVLGPQSFADARPFMPLTIGSDAGIIQQDNQLISLTDAIPNEKVLRVVGPHPSLRDTLSMRVIAEVRERSGGIIDFVTEPKNPEAQRGYGQKPVLANLVPQERLTNYKFSLHSR